jgi:DNA-3-methyladenine glycosylase
MTSLRDRELLDRGFYLRDTITVARDLLGMCIVRDIEGNLIAGRIVEVEAYIGEDDPACHARFGPTDRNRVMYGPGGLSYVYFIYGMYNMLNIVSDREGFPAAVLIRALEPVKGIERMKSLRGTDVVENLTSGPGKLCTALAIDTTLSGVDLTQRGSMYVVRGNREPVEIVATPRIGIKDGVDRDWRFSERGNPHVSR